MARKKRDERQWIEDEKMKLGFLYAGQGSQHKGMGADLYEQYPVFRAAFDEAKTDFDLKKVCFEDPDGVINQTKYTQPCMVAFAVGMTDLLKEKGIVPSVAAGLSLGEYSALYAAGVFERDGCGAGGFPRRRDAESGRRNRFRHGGGAGT